MRQQRLWSSLLGRTPSKNSCLFEVLGSIIDFRVCELTQFDHLCLHQGLNVLEKFLSVASSSEVCRKTVGIAEVIVAQGVPKMSVEPVVCA